MARFTTFLTYQEPGPSSATGGPLRVGLVVPVDRRRRRRPWRTRWPTTATSPTTLAVSPLAVSAGRRTAARRRDAHALDQLDALGGDQVLDQPYVPVNVAALSEAGLPGEIAAQIGRGDELLRAAGLKPAGGPGSTPPRPSPRATPADLATGLQAAGAAQLVLSDGDLAPGGLSNFTFAQPFSLDLGTASTVPAAAANSSLERALHAPTRAIRCSGPSSCWPVCPSSTSRTPSWPRPRGVVVAPPAGLAALGARSWTRSSAGSSGNPALSPVTLSQFFDQVPGGRQPRAGGPPPPAGPARPRHHAQRGRRIALDAPAARLLHARPSTGPPARADHARRRAAAPPRPAASARPGVPPRSTSTTQAFDGETGQITLATERTVTFTAQRAAIPVTVLSAAPYPVHVVVTLASDKFTFPDGNTRPRRSTGRPPRSGSPRRPRTSGDRLPIEVTLHTPDGQLVIAHTVLTVHSTAISFVGVALTVLAGAVLLVWWVRTWRRSRRRRARGRT